MNKTAPLCRWGILGAAQIARKNWKAIRLAGNSVVTAVASRDRDRAETFIHECSVEVPPATTDAHGKTTLCQPTAMGDYDELIQSDDVDAIYVALPTSLRKPWVLKAAAAGKHVLCEKPVAVHGDDATEMIQACRDAGVVFMDGVMFDHSDRIPLLRAVLEDGDSVGDVRRIQTHFSFFGGDDFEKTDIRADAALEPHGALGDLGWYCIRFTLQVMGGRLPTAVSGRAIRWLDDGRVPSEFIGEMKFENHVTAGFYCSFHCVNQQTAMVSGTKGTIHCDDFVLPMMDASVGFRVDQPDLQIDNCRWNFGRHQRFHDTPEYAGGEPNSQEVKMIRRFAEAALQGRDLKTHCDLALNTQTILDAFRRSDVEDQKWVPLG